MYAEALLEFIKKSPCAALAMREVEARLVAAGAKRIREEEAGSLGEGLYYAVRGGVSLIAMRVPKDPKRAVIAAAHTDSPALRVKDGGCRVGSYVSIPVEKYGGAILYSWFDRPLSVAGRVMLRTAAGVEERYIDASRPICYIPNPGLQVPTNAQSGATFNMTKDMLPLLSVRGSSESLLETLGKICAFDHKEVIGHDLFVYCCGEGRCVGKEEEIILCPRLDDLACAFAATEAFLCAKPLDTLSVLALFDHEEIGSATERGADSTFLSSLLAPFLARGGTPFFESSLLVSADNAHAVHPNFPEISDSRETPVLEGGVALKWSASHSYATDARSGAILRRIMERAGVPLQVYQNRADIRGGSTLGSIAGTHLGISTVDIGIPQLAMHSAVESLARKDLEAAVNAIRASLEAQIVKTDEGYIIG